MIPPQCNPDYWECRGELYWIKRCSRYVCELHAKQGAYAGLKVGHIPKEVRVG